MHALHTVHALPDLRVAGGQVGDVWQPTAATGVTDHDYNDVYETVGGSTIAGMFLLWLHRRR